MQAEEALKDRRSIRSFEKKPVPVKLIEEIIDCARFAPTARNVQPWEFVAVTNRDILAQLGSLAENGGFIRDCACCIAVFCADTKYYLEDGCAATVNVLTAIHGLGLAGCWVAGDKKSYCDKVKELLGAPGQLKLISLIPLGYSSKKAGIPPKRVLKEVLHWEKF